MNPTRLRPGLQVRLCLALGVSTLTLATHGALYTFSSTPSQAIPDNNASGLAYGFSFTETGQQITDVSVAFNISGGWNGDLYAYLTHGPSTLVLLNRVGVSAGSAYGYGDAGFNITLSDNGIINIHNYGGNSGSQLTGSYLADGQNTSPFASPANFLSGGGTATFGNVFGGSDPSGTWTLFFADVSGGSLATLDSWSVGIAAVPEPVHLALAVFGLLLAVAQGVRWLLGRAGPGTRGHTGSRFISFR